MGMDHVGRKHGFPSISGSTGLVWRVERLVDTRRSDRTIEDDDIDKGIESEMGSLGFS